MMKVLVVYDSVYGNTEKIAQAIGNSAGPQENVGVFQVNDVKMEHMVGLELMVVGSPTRAFKPTKAIIEFLKGLPDNGLKDVKVAAFDTRIDPPDIKSRGARVLLSGLMRAFGYAAKPIAERLEKKGGNLVVEPEGFFVKDSEGPLRDGELERAGEWITRLSSNT